MSSRDAAVAREGLHLYTWTTPNGRKVSICLEEMDLKYSVHPVPLRDKVQKEAWFLELNPNGRVPVLLDDGFPVFESGAILLHLAEKTGRFLPSGTQERSSTIQWLMWQMGGLGPMQGQANVFNRYWPEKIPSVLERYQNETRRLFRVMDTRLADVPYLAEQYSIADMACFPWVAQHDWSGIDLLKFPNLDRWFRTISERPAVKRGMDVPARQETPSLRTGKAIMQ